jgi:hypothetical protein
VKVICIYIPVFFEFTPWLLDLEGYKKYIEACSSALQYEKFILEMQLVVIVDQYRVK